jgi:hypothetical protein
MAANPAVRLRITPFETVDVTPKLIESVINNSAKPKANMPRVIATYLLIFLPSDFIATISGSQELVQER